MTDQEQMDWYNGAPYAEYAALLQEGDIDGLHRYATLEEFRAARHAAHQAALTGDSPMHRLVALLIPEDAWWDPTCPS